MHWETILKELEFRTSRSSGAGGQHVNKTESRVEVLFHVDGSQGLTPEEKATIHGKLGSRINEDGYLSVVSQKERSQFQNKEIAIENLRVKLIRSLTPVKRRVPTQPSENAKKERLEEKKKRGELKVSRKKPLPP